MARPTTAGRVAESWRERWKPRWRTYSVGAEIEASFSGSNACPLLFPFCPSYFCPLLILPPLSHSIDTSRCYRTSNILSSATDRSKRIPDDQPTPRMLLSREQVSALLSRLPQRRYYIALPILLNTCGATSDSLTLMCLPKSRLNQTSRLTVPPPLSYVELHK